MKITVSQSDKKISVAFRRGKTIDRYIIGKADDFLAAVDKFLKKRKIRLQSLKEADLVFRNAGLLTERIIRAIILGIGF